MPVSQSIGNDIQIRMCSVWGLTWILPADPLQQIKTVLIHPKHSIWLALG